MGQMSALALDIEDMHRDGMTAAQIAQELDIPRSTVEEFIEAILTQDWDDHVDFAHDALERDHDEPYEPEEEYFPDPDSEYEGRYDLHDY